MPLPNDCAHHATMLKDKIRLQAFNSAICEKVKNTDSVVDIGAGTGVLSAMAAQQTQNKVWAIEYFSASSNCAKKLIKNAGLNNIEVLEKSSFEVKLSLDPHVAITETIGPIGPEENIVELCYVFKKRHPKIRDFIPSNLTLFCQEVKSTELKKSHADYIASFKHTSVGSFNFNPILEDLEGDYAQKIHCLLDAETKQLCEPQTLVSYNLGLDKDSSFEKNISITCSETNALHLFFEARLSDNVVLSSHVSAPVTHWKHCFVPKPKEKNTLSLSYSAPNKTWRLLWS